MAKLTFYPLGNADSCLVEFADDRLMLVDYFYCQATESEEDKRCNLPEKLRAVLDSKKRDDFDVVAFTHADNDHVSGAEEFFWLEHADKYQGEGRIKIKQMWVPAYYILEQGLEDSARTIREEAKYRLKKGKGIRVFSQPNALDEWLKSNNIDPESRRSLITTAGSCATEFTKQNGQAEIFIHAPFKFSVDGQEADRNNASLVFHITFFEGERTTRAWFGDDAEYDIWDKIVYKTMEKYKTVDKTRIGRLIWDVFKISHHCSYSALSDEKGKDKTEPTKNIKYLFDQGQNGCYLISSSEEIPTGDTKQPPHRQAAAYYKEIADDKAGEFLVTMETPTKEKPEEIVIKIGSNGPTRDDSEKSEPKKPGGYSPRKEPSIIGGGRFA